MMASALCCSNYFQPAFDPLATLKGVQDHKIQRMLLVPTMINMVVHQPTIGDYDLEALESVWYGASPMPEAVIQQALKVMPKVQFYQVYGQTEAAPAITALLPERHTFEGPLAGKMKSAGQALPGIEVCIMDENNQRVDYGVVGEVCMRGPNIMKGYRNMEEQTANTIVDGWLHTGDGGYMDEEGFRLHRRPGQGHDHLWRRETSTQQKWRTPLTSTKPVSQCAVIGIPHEKWGESVHAIVVLKEGATSDEAELD
jgi:long-chain acyl-CoA synthetase